MKLALMLTLFAGVVGLGPAVAQVASSEVVVARPQDFNQVKGIEFQPDAPETTFIDSHGRHVWLTPLWNKTIGGIDHLKTIGDGGSPLKTFVWTKTQEQLFRYNHNPFPGTFWIVNQLRLDDGLLAIVHIENALDSGHDPVTHKTIGSGKSRIGLAWSIDDGETFTFLGEILIGQGDPDPSNIQGSPLIMKDGYIYLYFHDVVGLAVARAPLSEVVAGAKRSAVTPWMKFYKPSGGFASLGLGGPATGLGIDGISHSDAICISASKTCYMVLSRLTWPGGGSWVRVFASADLINWAQYTTLADLPPSPVVYGYQYCTTTNLDLLQHTADRDEFYVFCGKDYDFSQKRSLVRWTVHANMSAPH